MAEQFVAVPLSALRRIIAARMTEAQRTIPHFRLVADVEVDGLLRSRDALNAAHPTNRISLNDCLIKVCAAALVLHPTVNAQFVGDVVHQYCDADISVIVAVAGGVAAPIVRGANRKSVGDIAGEMKDLAARAAAGRLQMQDISGGSFSLSNLGGCGVDQFDAIINPPQCAILAVGRARRRVLIGENDQLRVATLARLTLSVDHRTIDGVVAAQFLATLRQRIEQPQEVLET